MTGTERTLVTYHVSLVRGLVSGKRAILALGLAVLWAALDTSTFGQQSRLYFFTQTNCPPCAQMVPVIDDLMRQGWPVTKIDVRTQPEWARQFHITQTPTTVLVEGNQITARYSGLLDTNQLRALVQRLTPTPVAGSSSIQEAPSTTTARAEAAHSSAGSNGNLDATVHSGTHQPTNQAEARAMAATVRLRLERDQDISFATGTIIHTYGNNGLVLTCGHMFRECGSHGQLTGEIGWLTDQRQVVVAQLLDYNADNRDVALVAIQAQAPLTAVPLAPAHSKVAPATSVFSIGCDRGDAPTIRRSVIKNVAIYDGATKYDIVGRPVVGRSGGGLFTAEGELIGVCNAAAVEVDEGIYTALENIYWQISKANLAHIFQSQSGARVADSNVPNRQLDEPRIRLVANESLLGERSPPAIHAAVRTGEPGSAPERVSDNRRDLTADIAEPGWEAIIVLRNNAFPDQMRTFTVNNPDPRVLSNLIGQDLSADRPRDSVDLVEAPPSAPFRRQLPDLAPIAPRQASGIRAQSPH